MHDIASNLPLPVGRRCKVGDLENLRVLHTIMSNNSRPSGSLTACTDMVIKVNKNNLEMCRTNALDESLFTRTPGRCCKFCFAQARVGGLEFVLVFKLRDLLDRQ